MCIDVRKLFRIYSSTSSLLPDFYLLNFSVEDCGPPPAISDGTVDSTGTVYLSEAAYSCETGFRVQPPASSVRVCEVGGVWSGENGACQREFVSFGIINIMSN